MIVAEFDYEELFDETLLTACEPMTSGRVDAAVTGIRRFVNEPAGAFFARVIAENGFAQLRLQNQAVAAGNEKLALIINGRLEVLAWLQQEGLGCMAALRNQMNRIAGEGDDAG